MTADPQKEEVSTGRPMSEFKLTESNIRRIEGLLKQGKTLEVALRQGELSVWSKVKPKREI